MRYTACKMSMMRRKRNKGKGQRQQGYVRDTSRLHFDSINQSIHFSDCCTWACPECSPLPIYTI